MRTWWLFTSGNFHQIWRSWIHRIPFFTSMGLQRTPAGVLTLWRCFIICPGWVQSSHYSILIQIRLPAMSKSGFRVDILSSHHNAPPGSGHVFLGTFALTLSSRPLRLDKIRTPYRPNKRHHLRNFKNIHPARKRFTSPISQTKRFAFWLRWDVWTTGGVELMIWN